MLPSDNILPWNFADCIYNKNEIVKECFQRGGFWKSSDRPPLFSAAILFLLPFKLDLFNDNIFYQCTGTIIQCTWVSGVYFLANSLGFRKTQSYFIILVLIFSGFCLLNSVFLWPKLITVLPYSFAFNIFFINYHKININAFKNALGYISLSIGFLFHGGILFSILSLIFFWFIAQIFLKNSIKRFSKSIKYFTLCIIFIIPWSLYQKIYDPPGDNLFKLRMAGHRTLDNPILYRNHPLLKTDQSLLSAMIESYSVVPLEDILNNKIENINTIFYIWIPKILDINNNYLDIINNFKSYQFLNTFMSADSLLLGCIFLPFSFIRSSNLLRNRMLNVVFVFTFSLIIWIILMFEPNMTIIHAGSYMNIIFLYLILAYGIFAIPLLSKGLFILHLIVFFYWTFPFEKNHMINYFYLIFSILIGLKIIYLLKQGFNKIKI